MNFQPPSRQIAFKTEIFHDYALLILILIISIISFILLDIFIIRTNSQGLIEMQGLELIWTIVPGILLIGLALPSLNLLYLIDEIESPSISLNILGHQWYWEYNYPDFDNLNFDSYLRADTITSPILLRVDNPTSLPSNTIIRILISSVDVLHSWALPALALKADATPGRINQVGVSSPFTGIYHGQCSEICGINHRFMPITLEMLPPMKFIKWL